jgi:hypothetical protein
MASRLPGPSEITLTAKDILTIADDQLSKLGASRKTQGGFIFCGSVVTRRSVMVDRVTI